MYRIFKAFLIGIDKQSYVCWFEVRNLNWIIRKQGYKLFYIIGYEFEDISSSIQTSDPLLSTTQHTSYWHYIQHTLIICLEKNGWFSGRSHINTPTTRSSNHLITSLLRFGKFALCLQALRVSHTTSSMDVSGKFYDCGGHSKLEEWVQRVS